MLESSLTVKNRLGLHARAAAQLVRLAGTFKSKIIISRTDTANYADAKSILTLLTLAAATGTVLKVEVTGEDEDIALIAIKDIFERGFGEL